MTVLQDSLVRRIVWPMVAGVLALMVVVGTSIWLTYRTTEDTNQVVQDRQSRELGTTLMDLLQDMETGHRGYLLTHEERYLEPYNIARPRVDEVLRRLRDASAAREEDTASLDRVAARIGDKLQEMEGTLQLARVGQYDPARDIVRLDRGKAAMDAIRAELGQIINSASNRIVARLASVQENSKLLMWISAFASLLVIFVVGAGIWTGTQYMRELLRARHAVETANASLESRVKARTYDLTLANEEIQRYAYIVTHDLRAPLVNIVGFTSELESGLKTLQDYVSTTANENAASDGFDIRSTVNEEMPEAIGFIRASTTKMDGLINAILKLSREGRRQLRPEKVDLKALFERTLNSVQHQIEAKNVAVEVPNYLPVITSDRMALEQIFGNLIDNALKYLAPGKPGELRLNATEGVGTVLVEVADNGRGIAPEDHERIFELFRRAGSQNVAGEGIGLAHVRAMVRRLGGDITVDSAIGRGSTFKVRLPKYLVLSVEAKEA